MAIGGDHIFMIAKPIRHGVMGLATPTPCQRLNPLCIFYNLVWVTQTLSQPHQHCKD